MNHDTHTNTHRVKRAIAAFSKMSAILDKVKENYRPTLNGEKLITDKELADFLKINKRSLVEYRKNGILPYYHIGGRILYKESDVERIMQENFYDVFGKTLKNATRLACKPIYAYLCIVEIHMCT